TRWTRYAVKHVMQDPNEVNVAPSDEGAGSALRLGKTVPPELPFPSHPPSKVGLHLAHPPQP
ncbi:MAG: hypothetical protein JRM86_03205, partial [Nitrososphaerota archaeon]|nr:hypothetical protein [Nitrososphaerota archaeon]